MISAEVSHTLRAGACGTMTSRTRSTTGCGGAGCRRVAARAHDLGAPLVQRTVAAVVPPLVVLGLLIGRVVLRVLRRARPAPQFLLHPPHEVVREGFLDRDNFAEILDGLWSSSGGRGRPRRLDRPWGRHRCADEPGEGDRAGWFPFLVTLQAIPILALVPMIQFWFGTDWRARVLVFVIISFFPIVLNTLFGLLSADAGLHDLITLHHGGRWTRLTKVMFPALCRRCSPAAHRRRVVGDRGHRR